MGGIIDVRGSTLEVAQLILHCLLLKKPNVQAWKSKTDTFPEDSVFVWLNVNS
jgi:hypothetical protein